MTQIAHFGGGHQHEVLVIGEREEPLALQLPFVVFDPVVALLVRQIGVGVILAVPQRVGRGELNRDGELRTAARVDRLADRAAREHELQSQRVGRAVLHHEVVPVFQRVAFVGGLGVEREVGVGPP